MLKRNSVFQIIFGALVLPFLILIFVYDRLICSALIWIKPPGLPEFLTDWKQFKMSINRVGFITFVYFAYLLIRWIV